MAALSPQRLSKLIGSIYDGVLDHSAWEQTFVDVKGTLDCQTAIELLLPHIRRAVMISSVLDVCEIERTQMARMLDTVRCAALLTDERGSILHANRSAEQMLSKGQLIQSVNGVLQANAPSAASELRAALTLAAKTEASIELVICLTEPDVPPIFAHVLPLIGSHPLLELQAHAVTAVFVSAAPDEQEAANRMAATFGLTPAETGVLASLLTGKTIAETAVMRGTAVTTAKTHLEHIFWKTGVKRQADLMRLVTQMVFTLLAFIEDFEGTILQMGTSKNRPYSSNATRLPANDSASFPFRFINVHSEAVSDRQRDQFFEVPK
jgi:DNA-binding CsgD family transcriptional regulator